MGYFKRSPVQSFNDYSADITKGDVYDFIQGDIESFYNQQGIRLVIVLRSTGQVIGSVGIFNIINGQGILGFELSSQYFGKGDNAKGISHVIWKIDNLCTSAAKHYCSFS